MPMTLPSLIGASSSGDWILLEAVPPVRDAAVWDKNDYLTAIEGLAELHDRFWGLGVVQILIDKANEVAAPLRKRPRTLLHGDYWPGNISILEGGKQVVYDWQLTGIGPSILDVLVFVKKSEWWFGSLPVSENEIVAHYREALESRAGKVWEGDQWDELWDHALMWRFMQEWYDLLAASPEPVYAASEEQLEKVWLIPVTEAVNRRLAVG
jgi:aminoglycoside phosphotransferase (APT) family kinase protein